MGCIRENSDFDNCVKYTFTTVGFGFLISSADELKTITITPPITGATPVWANPMFTAQGWCVYDCQISFVSSTQLNFYIWCSTYGRTITGDFLIAWKLP